MKRYKWIILGGAAVIFAVLFIGFNKGFSLFQSKPEDLLHESETEDLTYGQEESETTEEYNEAASKEERPKRVNHLYDNETPYEELITTKYSAEEMEYLEEYISDYKDEEIERVYFAIDRKYRFECVREGERVSYVMFQGEDGSLLCVFFDRESHDVYQVERFYEFYSVKDFEDHVQPGITSLDEIEAVFGTLANFGGEAVCNRVVKEGTLLIISDYNGETRKFIVYEMALFRDGESRKSIMQEMAVFRDMESIPEEEPRFIKRLPEMLPMDKHINKENK